MILYTSGAEGSSHNCPPANPGLIKEKRHASHCPVFRDFDPADCLRYGAADRRNEARRGASPDPSLGLTASGTPLPRSLRAEGLFFPGGVVLLS